MNPRSLNTVAMAALPSPPLNIKFPLLVMWLAALWRAHFITAAQTRLQLFFPGRSEALHQLSLFEGRAGARKQKEDDDAAVLFMWRHTHTCAQTHTPAERCYTRNSGTICSSAPSALVLFWVSTPVSKRLYSGTSTYSTSSLHPSCNGCFHLFIFCLCLCWKLTHKRPRAGLSETKSCAVRRCQRRAPTHPARRLRTQQTPPWLTVQPRRGRCCSRRQRYNHHPLCAALGNFFFFCHLCD